uniref:Uncharacterized protein n=1 Tax=Melopsittacus undulatus TaxID=13146 RepID=A0A8V5GZF0_MELUD
MPSPSESSRSLTGRTSRSLTHLRVQRTWLQVLLVLGFIQVILGVLIVTFSLVAATITPSARIRHSCPSWAGFSDLLFSVCGLTVLSTIVCTLSAVVCCIQIFSLDIVHARWAPSSSACALTASPHRPRSLTSEKVPVPHEERERGRGGTPPSQQLLTRTRSAPCSVHGQRVPHHVRDHGHPGGQQPLGGLVPAGAAGLHALR